MDNDACIETAVTTASLEQLERQLTAALYAIWRARGINKRVVDIKQRDGNDEQDGRLTGDNDGNRTK